MEDSREQDANVLSDWSGSMTPPLMESDDEILESQCVVPLQKKNFEDISIIAKENELLPNFECKEFSLEFRNDAILEMFQRLFSSECPYPNKGSFKNDLISLFGFRFSVEEGLTSTYRRKLFLLCRQHIFQLKNFDKSFKKINHAACKSVMQRCKIFFAYVGEMLHGGNNDEESVVQELRALISSIGRIHNHAVLEAYWHASTILTSLSLKDNATRFTCISTLEEYFTVIIWDLAVLALNMFTNDRNSFSSKRHSFLPCSCCFQMVLFVIHVSDKLSSTENCQGFWSLFSGVCSCLLDTSTKSAIEEDYFSKKAPPGFSVNEPITFAWWLLKMVAPLYKYDIGGTLVYKENMYLPSNWLLIQDLLKSTFNTKGPDTKESSAREALSTCLEVAAIWNPNPDVITYLWGYFCKRLNSSFSLGNQGILSTAVPNLSAMEWLEKFCFTSALTDSKDRPHQSNSYEMFLQIIAVSFLRAATRSEQGQLWSQLKGRFYSKFHKGTLATLNDVGISNFISLFLTLGHCLKAEDLVQKLCSFLGLIPTKNRSQSMSLLIIKGLYAIYSHCEQSLEAAVTVLNEKIQSNFDDVCRKFVERGSNPKTKQLYWQQLNLHLSCTEDLFVNDTPSVPIDYPIDIGTSLFAVSSNCTDVEARRISSFLHRILSTSRLQGQNQGNLQFVWSGIYPWLNKVLQGGEVIKRIPESLAGPAAGLTLISISRSEQSSLAPNFNELVRKFSSADLPARFSSQYLSHVLSESKVLERIISSDLQATVIRAWIRCLICTTDKQVLLLAITRGISQLPEVKDVIGKEFNFTEQMMDTNLIFSFIVAFGKQHSYASQLAEIVQLRAKAANFFGSLIKDCESIIQTGNPPDSLRLLYSIVGKLVKHCAKLIYSKTNPECLLPQILDQLVLPRQGPKKTVPATVNQCLIGHLHQFLGGLSTLDYKNDSFIKRKLKEIFSKYFLMITKRCNSSPNSTNPFLLVLQDQSTQSTPRSSTVQSTKQASDFRQFVMELIADHFLVLPQPPDNHSAALYFLYKLFRSTKDRSEIIRNSPVIIMQIMGSLISCDACGGNAEPPGIRQPAMDILALILKSYKGASSDDISKLQEQLQNVLQLNIPQFQGTVFKSFGVLAQRNPALARSLVGTAKRSVEEDERNRGCGEDKRLRYSLQEFIAATERS
ncbi:protein MMS22-like isoform X2 [Rhopilema esculentum]